MKSFFTLSLFLVLACNSKSTSPGGSSNPDFSKLTPDCYKPVAGNPILAKDELFSGATWNDPHVLKIGTQYVMYASSDNNFDQNIKIYRLVSSDGENFSLSPSSPVLSKGSGGGDWDRKSVETPAVVSYNGTYYMFYTGYPTTQTDATSYRIGYATSSDGISWTKQGMLVAPSGVFLDFNENVVAEPAPVVFNNKIYLYFTALGANVGVGTTLQTIGLMTFDGTSWSTAEKVLEPDQSQYPRASNWKGYSTPNAVVMNNKLHLYFDVVTDSPFEQVKIHHASSSDGKTSWTQDSTYIFDRSEFNPWADESLRSPSALIVGKSISLYFAGNGDTSGFPNVTMGIGLSKCSL